MQPCRSCLILILLLALALSACAAVERSLRDLGQPHAGEELDEATVIAGLREALRVGSGRAVESTGRVDGFLANELIRISLPESYRTVADGLRRVGLGERVNELEVAMNRAAEQAAGEARSILWDAVRAMSIEDGFRILRGGDTAATDYFRAQTQTALTQRFEPIVQAKMREVGLYRLHEQLADAYLRLPLSRREHLVDMDAYVTEQALEGLYTVLAREEQRIRSDPVARTTQLLRDVFGPSAAE